LVEDALVVLAVFAMFVVILAFFELFPIWPFVLALLRREGPIPPVDEALPLDAARFGRGMLDNLDNGTLIMEMADKDCGRRRMARYAMGMGVTIARLLFCRK
jgi:hypothetical protein